MSVGRNPGATAPRPADASTLIVAASEAFERASAAGLEEHDCLLAGRPVRFRLAGRRLAEAIWPAFAHLPRSASDAGMPTLTLNLWDGASSGGVSPLLPRWSEPWADGTRHEYDAGWVRIEWWHETAGIHDRSSRTAWCCYADAATVPWFERAAPLRHWLAFWAHDHGACFVHAGAVGRASGAVVLGGPAGSGKSTAALTCVGSPLRYAGDDYVIVHPDDRGGRVHSVYGTAKVEPSGAWRVRHVQSAFVGDERAADEKRIAFVARQAPDAMLLHAPIRAVVLPVITAGPTRLTAMGPGEAFRRIAPSTALQLSAGIAPRTMRVLADLLEAVPAFRLDLGDDFASVPARIGELLDG